MCTRPFTIRVPCNTYEKNVLGLQGWKEVTVPCGKCPECLMKRQKDVQVRSYREAKKYGSCWFLTLTYKPECVPFAQTLLDVNISTGEFGIHFVPKVCEDEDTLSLLRSEYRKQHSGKVYYHSEKLATFEGDDGDLHRYEVLYTPSLYYHHVKNMVKLFREQYFRSFGCRIEFSYICVGEYGRKSSIRPHYHILLFGLNEFEFDFFRSLWSYGNNFPEKVNFVNDDGSDGLAKVCGYIGKYSAKGTFNPESVLSGYTLPCRVASSRSFGLCDIDNLISHYRCYDYFGKYDIEKVNVPDEKRELLLDMICTRLKQFKFNGKLISLPVSLVRKIFGFRVFDGQAVWSKLYYQVMDFARVRNQNICDREFKEFLARKRDRPLSLLVDEYEDLRKSRLQIREESEKRYLARFYSNGKI